jgi:phytoene desaturase
MLNSEFFNSQFNIQNSKLISKHAVVIGAGLGGMSAAIRLAGKGWRVTVLEQLSRPGGKMGEVRDAGFRWDTGPSVITMRHVYEQLFRDAQRDLSDFVDLIPLNPVTRYFWRDGATIDAVTDEDAMCENIRAAFGPRDVDGYRKFMRYARRLHDVVSGPFLYRTKPSFRELMKLPLADVLKIDALRTMHGAVKAHFKDPHLVQLFDRFATYNGSSPYKAPATLNVIAHVEMAQGAWYPRGGIYQLALAYERLAKELSVEFCYNTPASEIIVRDSVAKGVGLANGDAVEADAVVCNADYTFAQETLLSPTLTPNLPQAARPFGRRSASPSGRGEKGLEPSCSGFVLMLGARGNHDKLAHHNIFFTSDYPREFDDIFKRKIAPKDPTIYLCITSKSDAGHAPAGHENWFVLINAPYLSAAVDWSKESAGYARHVRGLLVNHIDRVSPIDEPHTAMVTEHVFTPQDLQRTYGGHRGAIYGFSSNNQMAAFMRPANRAGAIKRLYYASGSAHPGGGVPLVTLSGMAAAQCVEEDAA